MVTKGKHEGILEDNETSISTVVVCDSLHLSKLIKLHQKKVNATVCKFKNKI